MSTKNAAAPKPLDIVIVGAGLGGLFAATALRKAGHIVNIYESSRFATETGAAIHIPPNVNGLLRRYGMIPDDHGANDCEWVSERRNNGEIVFKNDVRPVSKAFAYPWQLIHRIDLHNSLKVLATREEGDGKPVVIHLTSRVAKVDTENTSITLVDGTEIKGDLVIGADGVHSVTRNFVLGETKKPVPSGTSAFRFLIPTSVIQDDPKTAHFVETRGELRMISAGEQRLVMYPCRGNSEQNFVALHKDQPDESDAEGWNNAASKESLLRVFEGYQDDVKALLAKTPADTLKLWKLLDLEALPFWTKNNVTLLGDAAHPFMPHQGQGGAQAMEDAAALGALLPLGTTLADIPARLKLYTECRYERATIVQDYSRDSGFSHSEQRPSKRMMDPLQFSGFNFDHDAHDHATGALKRHLSEQAKFKRMPAGFGPVPSPRQDLMGNPRTMNADARYTTSYITFKTKKAYLQTLLPSPELTIKARGGWTTATFSVTKLENLEWLGGRGYSFFGLYIHNVGKNTQSPLPDPSETLGDVLPVLFENMADPIITGREEVGFAKAFATLEGKQSESSYSLSAGWEGTSFCELELSDLVAEADAEKVVEAPLYSHMEGKYVQGPALAMGGKREKKWKAGRAKIEFTKLQGGELVKAFPTLKNVVEGLRGIEVVEVVASGIRASL